VEGSGCGQLFQHVPVGTEENCEKLGHCSHFPGPE
jgi:hypothetical protein